MGGVTDWVMDDVLGFDSGAEAANAAQAAAGTQAAYQGKALDYLKEVEQLPRQYREAALQRLAGISGLPGGEGDQQAMIQQAISSPLYQAILGGRQAGEEAILRSASATGGLRSGNVQSNLYDYNTQLQNQALLEAYNQQLSGISNLANLPSNANNIAALTGGIGSTLAQGQVAAAQAQQQQQQQNLGGVGSLIQLGVAAAPLFMTSDRRLKKNIKKIAKVGAYNWYSWNWNAVAEKMGLKGKCQGVMADEAYEINPKAIILNGPFLWVNYGAL